MLLHMAGCYDGCVYIVEASSGNVEWCFQTDGKSSGDPMKSSPSVHPTTGFLWFGSHDKHLYCIDISVSKRYIVLTKMVSIPPSACLIKIHIKCILYILYI